MRNRAHILDRAVAILMANYINIICRFRRSRSLARALCVDKLLRTDERARLRPLSTPYGFSRWAIAHFAVMEDERTVADLEENIPTVWTPVARAHAREHAVPDGETCETQDPHG